MYQATESEARKQYNEFLDELEPLHCFPALLFSDLLEHYGGITYNAGFHDFCENIEIID